MQFAEYRGLCININKGKYQILVGVDGYLDRGEITLIGDSLQHIADEGNYIGLKKVQGKYIATSGWNQAFYAEFENFEKMLGFLEKTTKEKKWQQI